MLTGASSQKKNPPRQKRKKKREKVYIEVEEKGKEAKEDRE